jgi:hypothetical protein
MNPSTSQGSYRRQKAKNSVAPKLPLHRSSEALLSDEAIGPPSLPDQRPQPASANMMTSASTDGNMGFRQDTSMLPLRVGEVRVPSERPPMIFGRWASVTQTGEMFPSNTAEFPHLTSPGTAATPFQQPQPPHHGEGGGRAQAMATACDDESVSDGLDEMEKHVSNMLLDDDEIHHPAADESMTIGSPNSSERTKTMSTQLASLQQQRTRCVPDGVILITPFPSGTVSTMLKRISDHLPRFLFPPPPPPVADLSCYDNRAVSYSPLMRKKMMRWYQIVELWCIERTTCELAVKSSGDDGSQGGMLPADSAALREEHSSGKCKYREVADNERAIVAPPPRPPMFSEHVAPQLEVRKWNTQMLQANRAPYSVDQWINVCRSWWVKVMHTFDRLRDETKYEGFHHVSKECTGRVWTPSDVLLMVA